MYDGVSSMLSFCPFVWWVQNRLIPLLKRIHHLFLPMTDCTLRTYFHPHWPFFFGYAVELDGESKQAGSKNAFFWLGFWLLHKDGWIFETWDPWGRFIYSWSTCTIQRDLSWRLLNLVLPPFLVSISVHLQTFCNTRKVQDTFCAKRSSTHYSSSYWASLKFLSHTRWCYSHFPIHTRKSWNLQRCSVSGSCTLELDEKRVKTGKWF
jgi:hypothetical protein